MFLEKAYTIWRMPLSKLCVRWGTWRKGIGGPVEPPQGPKVGDISPAPDRKRVETHRWTSKLPTPIKVEEQQEDMKNTVLPPSRTTSAPSLPVFQSQPERLPSTPKTENCASNGTTMTSLNPEDISFSSDIDPEERKLLLRIPLELFYPPPPPEHCCDGRFRWKCPIRGCSVILDSASNYTELFSGFSEVEAEWPRSKPGSTDSQMSREVIYHILCRHYESHLEDSGVEIVDVGSSIFWLVFITLTSTLS